MKTVDPPTLILHFAAASGHRTRRRTPGRAPPKATGLPHRQRADRQVPNTRRPTFIYIQDCRLTSVAQLRLVSDVIRLFPNAGTIS